MTTERRETPGFTDTLVTATRRVQRYLLIVAFIFFARDFILLYLDNALSGDLVSMSLVVPAFFYWADGARQE